MTRYNIPARLILTAIFLASITAYGQTQVSPKGQTPAVGPERHADDEDSPVFDDDGGRVFIVTRGEPKDLSGFRFHGGEIINQPRLISVFLGAGWSEPDARSREARLSGILAQLDRSTDGAELKSRGVTFLGGSPIQVQEPYQFPDTGAGDRSVSDLQIQQVLFGLIENRQILPPDENMVYVVFLAPEIKSTIGGLLGRKHYLAYHNFFHVQGAQVRYVVMPFEPNRKAAGSIATRALALTILNPSGGGWF